MTVLILSAGCSTQNKLNRIYKGKNESLLNSKFGQPTRIEKLTSGNKIEIFEKRTMLRQVSINTGEFRYDRFDSPKTTKIETYKFEINQSGLIEDVRYDRIYER
jgi:hypothetical protein